MVTKHIVPTLDDVARAAGVSRSTASRAINGGDRVSPEAQQAVDAAILRLGYAPNRAARSLVTRRTDSIALVVPEPDARILTDPFLAGVVRGVSEGLGGTDLQLVLLLARPGERPGHIARYLNSGHVDGVIIASHHKDDRLEPELRSGTLPGVFVGRPFDSAGLHYVDVDNAAGARVATQRLVDRGCRSIAAITGPQDMTASLDRHEGWRRTLSRAGLPTDAVANGDFTVEGGAAAMERVLADHPDIDGVFAASDLMASGALQVLRDHGKKVPDDVAVVGFDALGAERTTPRLTTVLQPVVEMVAAATSTLLDMLAGEDVHPEPRIFVPRLVEGDSA
ncbi:LacI family transcriptional regulator [Isoptericola sp. CG 20/1183]|uniref:LacI family transcriptional regulator n=1 Tax=Isoptericola halotolerans TaxID=300560 RepID=A0ABX5EGD8_9MICO|nr:MULTISPECIES: LacI family DNA-binding transcriptional regulator [Isoptericola]MCK0117794.1 LacI family transcriptional regulator [Isoptericola sp. S6320L]PRZ06501.1 LacI family transcriptional regulator [Isoptericola halotolerans]PRZ06693.1 LacI family transcriptional regulator [Isoptericola sp. CG 20/1183]